jgi:chromosome segregation ATPase
MFGNRKEIVTLKERVTELDNTIEGKERKIRDLEQEAKHADEDIRHLVKINEEKNDIELERKKVELEGEQQKAIAAVKDDYRDKVEKNLETRNTELKDMYGQILARLPEIKVKLDGLAG